MNCMCKIGKLLVVLLCVLAACPALGQVVPVEIAVSFSRTDSVALDSANAVAPDTGDVWIFVLDHSGSMADEDAIVHVQGRWSSGERKTSRWNALLDSFRATLSHIEPGAIVQVVRVSDEKAELIRFGSQNAMVISGDRERDAIYKTVEKWGRPAWRTPLWHGLFLASQEAKRFISTENRNVGIIVFSDGKDESDNGFSKDSLAPFHDFFEQDEFTACLTWINSKSPDLPELPFGPKFLWAKPPQSGNVVPVVCRVRPEVPFVSVRNPLSGEGRTVIPVGYSFPLSEEKWNVLLETGFEANLRLVSRDGQVVGGEAVPVGTSRERVVFRVPESSFQGQTGSEFSLRLDLPQTVQGCRFVSPRPVRLAFEKQGSVTISEVAPRSGVVAKVGETVHFAALGTTGASYSWNFGDGEKVRGQRVSHAFAAAAPEGVSFSVTAEKPGLVATTSSGTVVVLDAGVSMDAIPAGIKVGTPVEFSCRGKGEVHSYEWFVDGAPVGGGKDAPDASSSRLSFTFDTAGKHAVRVRANMKRVSPEETQDIPFQVAEAPYAVVVKPAANDVFGAEDMVEFEARVEGGFVSGVWLVEDENGVALGGPIPAPVAEKVARAKFSPPESGGRYAVAFLAGEGPEAVRSTSVPFSSKPKDVRIDIVSPVRDAVVKTDGQTELRVVTKGLAGGIGFFLEKDGREIPLGDPVKVAGDGTAALAWTFSSKDGQGERVLLARSGDGGIVSDPLPFVLEMDAGLVLKKPAYNATVAFGEVLDFEADVSGIVESKSVQWFLRPVGGEEQELPDGKTAQCSHRFDAVPNRKSISYEVYARSPLPDGSTLETDRVVVRASCPPLAPTLRLGEKTPEAGKPVTFTVEHAGRAVKYVWNFGDGQSEEGTEPQIAHAYERPGAASASVALVCSVCGEECVAESTVEVCCPSLSPVLSIARAPDAGDDEPFSRGKPIAMALDFETPGAAARAQDIVWDFGDGSTEANLDAVSHSFVEYGERTLAVRVRCSVCGREETAKKSIRIDKVTPKPHFQVCSSSSTDKPAGTWISQGGTIALVSTSTGDVADYRWTCNGEPIPDSAGLDVVEFDCSTVGKQTFVLTVYDPSGEPFESEAHSVRVYRLWLVLLLLFIAAVASGYFWWLYSGDDPRFWVLRAKIDSEGAGKTPLPEVPYGSGVTKRFTGIVDRRSCKRPIWDVVNNQAVLPFWSLVGSDAEPVWGKKTKCGEKSLIVSHFRTEADKAKKRPGKPQYATDAGDLVDMQPSSDGLYCSIRAKGYREQPELNRLCVQVEMKPSNWSFLLKRVLLTGLFFALAALAAAQFAF